MSANGAKPEIVNLASMGVPEGPGKRIHIDFAGPFENKTLLCVVDAYSKWPEVVVVVALEQYCIYRVMCYNVGT